MMRPLAAVAALGFMVLLAAPAAAQDDATTTTVPVTTTTISLSAPSVSSTSIPTSTTVATEVLGAQETPVSDGDELAVTGISAFGAAAAALGLLAMGGLLLVTARLGRARAQSHLA